MKKGKDVKMLHKKGISQAVGFVLIIAITIGLAVFVGTWMKDRSEETAVDIASDLEKTTRCDDTTLRAIANCDSICSWDLDAGNCVETESGVGCHFFDEDQVTCEQNWEICKWDEPASECLNEHDGAQFCGAYIDQGSCVEKYACDWNTDNPLDPFCEGDTGTWSGGCGGYDIEECGERAGRYIGSITLENKGLFSIVGLKCNGLDVDEIFEVLLPDEVRNEEGLNNCLGITKVLMVPFVGVSDGETFGCVTKKVTLEC
ncbi:MAG: hypothetical protein ABIB47_05635 [Candidatus Woesearchaeota archaeon]